MQIGNKKYQIDDNNLAIIFDENNPTTIKLDVKSLGDTKELLIKPDPEKSGVIQENPNPQRIHQVLQGDEDAEEMLDELNKERGRQGGKREKMQATNERVLLPGKKRASVVYLQGKTKYVRKCGDWETLKKAARKNK